MIGFTLLSCDNSRKVQESESPNAEETSDENPLEDATPIIHSYEIKTIEEKDHCNAPPCTEVSIAFPQFTESSSNGTQFNELIKEKISLAISDYVMTSKGDESIHELISQFMASYRDFKENFPDSTTPWSMTVDVIITYTHANFISMSINTSAYTGGAHSNSWVSYLNIRSNGDPITDITFFVNSPTKLTAIVEQKFREEFDLKPNDSLSEKGFTFENDQFILSDNFGFTETGITFLYNPYEIASYATGVLTVSIPFNELEGLYKLQML